MALQKEKQSTADIASVIKIPGYEIKSLLGRGGMAVVYLAVQQSIGREVALKVLAPDHTDETFSERFLTEARIVSHLSHPNIVTVYDAGVHQGNHYMSMEYIKGANLREARDELSRREKISMIMQVASALEYAGGKGYVHRDIKPENIMRHEDGRAILMDFGIARSLDATHALTVTGKAIGTPYYMSPEQTKGLKVDPRSDIYSLGVVLFQALAGRVPYDGPSFVAIGIKHISEPIPLLPPGLEIFQPIINRCMSKDPEHRYQSAGELAKALAALPEQALHEQATQPARSSTQVHQAATVVEQATPKEVQPSAKAKPKAKPARVTAKSGKPKSLPPIDITGSDDYRRLKRRRRLLIILLLTTIIMALYHRQADLQHLLVNQIMPWFGITTPIEQTVRHRPQPKATATKQTAKPVVAPATATAVAEAVVVSSTEATAGISPEVKQTTTGDNPETVAAEPIATVPQAQAKPAAQQQRDKLEKLWRGLQENPENALKLAIEYKAILIHRPEAPPARRGLDKLRRWYGAELKHALKADDLVRARLLMNMARESFPRATQGKRFAFLQQQLEHREKLESHLQKARGYVKAKKFIRPRGANAVDEYHQVLRMAPQNAEAKEGLQEIAGYYHERGQALQAKGELQEAINHTVAGLKAVKGHTALLALQKELRFAMQLQQRIQKLLRQAKAQLNDGRLIEPKGKSAYDLYQLVVAEEPANRAASKGLVAIEQQLLARARSATRAQQFKQARVILNNVRKNFGDSAALTAAQKGLADAVEATLPKVNRVLFDDQPLASMTQQQAQKLRPGRTLYIGISYKNFAPATTLLQAHLLDGSGQVVIAQKPVIVSGAVGRHFFTMELPVEGFAEGTYKLDLLLKGQSLIRAAFQVARPQG